MSVRSVRSTRSSVSERRKSSIPTMLPSATRSRRSSICKPKDQTRVFMEKKEAEREERRRAMRERKEERADEEKRNIAVGNPGDVDFIGLVRKWREEHSSEAQSHSSDQKHPRICICVRKRPVSDKEREQNDHDSVTLHHPAAWVHSAKYRVDGITKYLDHSSFGFDHAFDENVSSTDVYRYSTMPLIDFVCSGTGGRATVFAYGQTGSGKTYTMEGIQELVAEDLFLLLSDDEDAKAKAEGCSLKNTVVTVAFFEIYGGYIQDLLNERKRLKLLEDGKGEIVVTGLEEFEAHDPTQLLDLLESGNSNRTTRATEKNDTSSRSHAICQILLRDKKTSRLRGKLSLVDLAGSERGSDTKSHNSARRGESAEINTSLLSLKECIRALDMNKTSGAAKHVPYRASNLTKILKDCFTSRLARTTMIATLSPGASSADHTINTLRYADRIKERKVGGNRQSLRPNDAIRNSRKEKQPRSIQLIERGHFKNQAPKELDKMVPIQMPHSGTLSSTASEDEEEFISLLDDEIFGDDDKGYGDDTLYTTISPVHYEVDADSFEPPSVEPPLVEPPPVEPPSVEPQPVEPQHVVRKKKDDEVSELRRTMEALYDEEENMLNLHMASIQENAELLTEEGQMLQNIQAEDASEEELENYSSRLNDILERKTHMIQALQEKVSSFQLQLKRKQELSRKVREDS